LVARRCSNEVDLWNKSIEKKCPNGMSYHRLAADQKTIVFVMANPGV
jgi:hypothetical protein